MTQPFEFTEVFGGASLIRTGDLRIMIKDTQNKTINNL
jgi:hypothetical protein